MRIMKKLTAVLLCFLTMVTMSPSTVNVFAATSSSGVYQYEAVDGGVKITKYTGKSISLSIPSTIDGQQVVEIGESAFAGNITIKTVTIPSGITSIDDYAFESLAVLQTVNFSKGLKTIGKGAFSECGHLKKITLPSGITTVEDGAFLDCDELTAISVPTSLSKLGAYSLANTSLKSIQIPSGSALTEIEDRTFYNDTALKTVIFPEEVKKLGSYVFFRDDGLQKVSLGGVTEIGNNCFDMASTPDLVISDCSNVKKIDESATYYIGKNGANLTEGVETIECGGYWGDTSTVTIPASVTDIEGGAFKDVGCKTFKVASGNKNYTAVNGIIYTKDLKTLVAVPYEKTGEITIPETTETIGAYAFDRCENLTGITIPDSVTAIEEHAFDEISCAKATLTIPESVTSIGEYALSSSTFSKIQVEAPITETSKAMFMYNDSKTIVLPETLTSIGDETFYGNNAKVQIPKSVDTIGQGAFLSCTGKVTVESGGSISIKDNLLYMDDGKTLAANFITEQGAPAVSVADGVTKILPYALVTSEGLGKTTIPDSVEEVGEYSLGYNSPSIETVHYGVSRDSSKFVIYSSSQEVKDYARTNAIACFQGTAKLNTTAVTLAGDGDVQLKLKNVDLNDVVFTSSDPKIATVTDDGTITGQRKGSTYVVAAVGHKYFKCAVTVSSNADNPYTPEFDESEYTVINKSNLDSWVQAETSANKDTIATGSNCNVATMKYKGDEYYSAIKSVQPTDESQKEYVQYRIDAANATLGKGYEDMIQMMNHGLQTELHRMKNTTDNVLYSGTNDITLLTGANANMTDIKKDAVGNTYTIPISTSTSLSENVAYGFGDIVLIIYADQDAIDGGYIEQITTDIGEYELLLNPGVQFKIEDAGVRYKQLANLSPEVDGDHNTKYTYERYVKCSLTTDSSTRKLHSFNISVDQSSVTYTGKAQTPSLTVKAGEKVLTEGTDYTLTYSNNTKIGKATVKVTGKGNYSGTVTKTFKIVPKTPKVKSVKSGKNKVTVKMTSAPSATGASYYQLKYKRKGAKSWTTKTFKTSSITLKKLKKGKKYQIKVRAYKSVSGTKYYSSYTTTKTSKKVK